jgi:hypothetical protein
MFPLLKKRAPRASKMTPSKQTKPYPHFLRACAVEMHMDISEGNFYARICNEKVGGQRAYLDVTPALTLTVRTRQCGHTAWGNRNGQMQMSITITSSWIWVWYRTPEGQRAWSRTMRTALSIAWLSCLESLRIVSSKVYAATLAAWEYNFKHA